MPPLVAAAAARLPGLVPSHFVDMGSGIAFGGVIHEPQPAALHAAARNLYSELSSAAPRGPGQSAATHATQRRTDYSPPWSAGASSSVELHYALQPAAMPAVVQPPGCGQLTVQVLTARDRAFLDRLQRTATAYPLSNNVDLRNDLCLDQTIRDGPFLSSFLTARGVETFAGTEGSLLDDSQLWKRVSNDAFFTTVKRVWDFYDAPHSS
jgi:hypothetical protein